VTDSIQTKTKLFLKTDIEKTQLFVANQRFKT